MSTLNDILMIATVPYVWQAQVHREVEGQWREHGAETEQDQ